MIRAMLADRFHLKSHLETRVMQGFVMSVDKNGPRLPAPRFDVEPGSKGSTQIGDGLFWARGASMSGLATALRYELDKPVIDETKIDGNYDFKLRFDEANTGLSTSGQSAAGQGSVFGALHELGLRLEAKKISIQVLVIDSVEKPDEN